MEDENHDATPQGDSFTDRSAASQLWYDVRLCLGFLTRIPVFSVEYSGHGSLAGASWAFPIVGVFVGLTGAIVLWLATEFGLASQLAAVLATGAMILLTGALHEDGLADTADGFGLGGDVDRRLAAMRDPRIGVYGMITLVVVFTTRWIALSDLTAISLAGGSAALIAAAAVSRGILPYIMQSVPNARSDGLGVGAGQPDSNKAFIALGIAAVVAVIAFGFGGAIVVAIVVGLITFALIAMAKRLIGGQTGDVLGAIQQAGEVAVLVTAASLAS